MSSVPAREERFRWGVLALLSIAQLMVILDGTIVHVAMPSAQEELRFATGQRAWIVTAYALAFGSLLLLGGRLGDRYGRRRMLVVGLLGFATVSAIGGQAQNVEMLIAARALQGVFAALLAPAALGLLAATFVGPRERARAFSVFGTVSGIGAAIGLVLGGALTDLLSWRWCLYINVAMAVPVAIAAWTLLPCGADDAVAKPPRIDVAGAITASLGLLCLVLAFAFAETRGWGEPGTILAIGGGIALLCAFVELQRRVAQPLLPLGILRDRDRAGALAAIALNAVALLSSFLFLTYYFQRHLGFSAMRAGVAFLPMTVTIMGTGLVTGTRILPRVGPRRVIPAGMAVAACALAYLAQLEADSRYVTGVLPAVVVLGVGVGLIFSPAVQTATSGVGRADLGVASAATTAMHQIGGAVGTALLSSVVVAGSAGYLESRGGAGAAAGVVAAAEVHGFTAAFWCASAIFAGGAVLLLAVFRPDRDVRSPAVAASEPPLRAPGRGAA